MPLKFVSNIFSEYAKMILRLKEFRGNKIPVITAFYYFKFKRKHILAHPNTIITGLKNIFTADILALGIDYNGLVNKKDNTFLNVQGKLIAKGAFSIGSGCRFYIASKGVCVLNKNSYIGPFTNFIIEHGIIIGEGCAISWYCQFLDEDFHTIEYDNKKVIRDPRIVISDNVWIGCYVYVFKGTFIASGCVVAANAVVRGVFEEENCLIAGNPAKVVKKNISWR
jgi:acetyltransferase-like isoleucine patch superfamily enzyme